jgi:hypothetical protein
MRDRLLLRPTGLEGQFRDERGQLWVANDARLPHSNGPDETYCTLCGLRLAGVVYMLQQTGGPELCDGCVEVRPPRAEG